MKLECKEGAGVRAVGEGRVLSPLGCVPHCNRDKRGEVNSFSRGSARRLREAYWTYEGHGREWAGTLTARHGEEMMPGELAKWQNRLLNWRRKMSMTPCIWRLELHKSGHPHLHVLVWGDLSRDNAEIFWRDIWGVDCGESGVKWRENDLSGRWLVYMGMHNSKGTQGEGWHGRYWGMTGRDGLRMRRTACAVHVPESHERLFNRYVECVLWLRGQRRRLGRSGWLHLGLDSGTVCLIANRVAKRMNDGFQSTIEYDESAFPVRPDVE